MAEIDRGVIAYTAKGRPVCPYCRCPALDWEWLVKGKYVGVFCIVCGLRGVIGVERTKENEHGQEATGATPPVGGR